MARRNRNAADLSAVHSESVSLGERRTLARGDEFTVKGEGRFKFLHIYRPDGSVTAWGPVGSQQAMMRSFTLEQVGTIHRTKRSR